MSLTSPGIGSGLDVKTIVDALVKSDIEPSQMRLSRKANTVNTSISALGSIKSALARFQTALGNLTDIKKLYNVKNTMTDVDHFSVSSDGHAEPGIYQIEVKKLAQRQNLSSQNFPANSTIGSGSIKIQLGTYNADNTAFTNNPDKPASTINIAAGSSLQNIRDAINNSNSGVQANIISDNQGSKITITSKETGESSAMQISVIDADGIPTDAVGLSALAYDPTLGINSMEQKLSAQNSEVVINGNTVINNSNTLKDTLIGVSLDLKKAEEGKITTLTMENDKAGLTGLVKDFVKQYNDCLSAINATTDVVMSGTDERGKPRVRSGPMQGDTAIRSLKFRMAQLATSPIDKPDAKLTSLMDLGIKTDAKGLMILDDEKLKLALENNYSAIGDIFAKTATTSDNNMMVSTVGNKIKAGTYNINLETFGAGQVLKGTIGGVLASSSDGITLKGSQDFKGLTIKVLGGSTGDRGSISIYDGIGVQLENLLDTYLNSKEGVLTKKAKDFEHNMDVLNQANDKLIERAQNLEKRYLRQYTALDKLITQMQASAGALSQQFNNLNQG